MKINTLSVLAYNLYAVLIVNHRLFNKNNYATFLFLKELNAFKK
jgi:hypothetical protein